jgi:hypothetical protein
MSWRIEQAHALTLLRELPDQWAQTCVTHTPRTSNPNHTLAILTEVRRVLRNDGTLWIFLASDELLLTTELHHAGFTQQSSPDWATTSCKRAWTRRLFLFTKTSWYFDDTHTTCGARNGSPSPPCVNANRQDRRAQTCLPAREHEHSLRLVKRCILAGSSLVACGECGAPYTRTRSQKSAPGPRHPTCQHNNPNGCCLVLDPFYDPTRIPTAEAALCTRRSFLGITKPPNLGEHR